MAHIPIEGSYVEFMSTPSGDSPRTVWNGVMDVHVYQVDDQAGSGRALVFQTTLGSRTAYVFPTNWRDLSDAALLAISDRTPD